MNLTKSGCMMPITVNMLQLQIMNRDLSELSTVVAVKDQVSSDLGGEVTILDLGGGIYYGLDAVGARVWELAWEPIEVNQIQETIMEEYDADRARIERDVLALLQRLAELVSRYVPATCLSRALSAQGLLARRAYLAVLHFVAVKEGERCLTHGWLVSGGQVVIGGYGLEPCTLPGTLNGNVA
ncbi:MAG: lasso peptide biosynthesis B2 protein [Actinomycetota bacterium]|nr:lasso peptide biosynthesis B2 protein [Actinomycetota bacterium]